MKADATEGRAPMAASLSVAAFGIAAGVCARPLAAAAEAADDGTRANSRLSVRYASL